MSDTAYRDYRGTKGQVDDATKSGKRARKSDAPANKKGSDYSDAKKTEHEGSQGEKAYGAPMDRQTTDSNNE